MAVNVAIIPARGGSKRIPGKNIRMFHREPIIVYSIAAAKKSGLFDGGVWVSTEDDTIADVAHSCGAGVIARPPELAEIGVEDCGTQEVTRHAIEAIGRRADHACCIYPCAPMLTAGDLLYSFDLFIKSPYRYVYVNGWFYWGDAADFGENPALDSSFEMDRLIGDRWIDINTEDDWHKAERMYAALHA